MLSRLSDSSRVVDPGAQRCYTLTRSQSCRAGLRGVGREAEKIRRLREVSGCKIYERSAAETARRLISRCRRETGTRRLPKCSARRVYRARQWHWRKCRSAPPWLGRLAGTCKACRTRHREHLEGCRARFNQRQDCHALPARGEVAAQEAQGSVRRAANGRTVQGEGSEGPSSRRCRPQASAVWAGAEVGGNRRHVTRGE